MSMGIDASFMLLKKKKTLRPDLLLIEGKGRKPAAGIREYGWSYLRMFFLFTGGSETSIK
jgi:hypothetical protein